MNGHSMQLRSASKKPQVPEDTPLGSPIKLTDANLAKHTKRAALATLFEREVTGVDSLSDSSDNETDHSLIVTPSRPQAPVGHKFGTLKKDLSQTPVTPANRATAGRSRRITNAPRKNGRIARLNLEVAQADASTDTSSVHEPEREPALPLPVKQTAKPLRLIPPISPPPSLGSSTLKDVYEKFGAGHPHGRAQDPKQIFLRESRRLALDLRRVKTANLAAKIKKRLEENRQRRLKLKKQRKGVQPPLRMRFIKTVTVRR